ncbi:MAG: recombination protein RecR [Planctomycetes bacterium]|nr:recombination protein RecR [Planctomycetota bacterium]
MTSGNVHPEPVERLIDELAKLPGIGRRSAERMTFHLLKATSEDAMRLSVAIKDIKTHVQHCQICSNLTDQQICHICAAPNRDASSVMVVEQPKDMISFEQTGTFKGVYHVLMGRLDPLGGIGPESLTIQSLISRIDDPSNNCRGVKIKEVILGLNPNMEGDSTALYLADQLTDRDVTVTRLARGLPAGSQLEYANSAVLTDAIQGRQPMSPHK